MKSPRTRKMEGEDFKFDCARKALSGVMSSWAIIKILQEGSAIAEPSSLYPLRLFANQPG